QPPDGPPRQPDVHRQQHHDQHHRHGPVSPSGPRLALHGPGGGLLTGGVHRRPRGSKGPDAAARQPAMTNRNRVATPLLMPWAIIGPTSDPRHSRARANDVASAISTGTPSRPCGWMMAKTKPLAIVAAAMDRKVAHRPVASRR